MGGAAARMPRTPAGRQWLCLAPGSQRRGPARPGRAPARRRPCKEAVADRQRRRIFKNMKQNYFKKKIQGMYVFTYFDFFFYSALLHIETVDSKFRVVARF
jgi:hypothetical protein